MSPEECTSLREVLNLKNVKQFRQHLLELEDKQIELLIECFINLPKLAVSKKDKTLVNKHHRIFKQAIRKVLNLRAAKTFLVKHFKLLKKVIATVAYETVCGEIAEAISENGSSIVESD